MGKGEIARNEQFLLFPPVFSPHFDNFLPFSSNLELPSADSVSLEESKICRLGKTFKIKASKVLVGHLFREPTITRRQILDSSKLKEFADDNFKFDENGRKLSKRLENTVEKEEIARHEQFLLFSQCFRKACFPGASKGVIVWEWVNNRKKKERSHNISMG